MPQRLILFLFISLLLLLIDAYVLKALLAVKIKLLEKWKKTFITLWWGYSILLILAVLLSAYFNIKLTARAVILVGFFLSFVSKISFLPFLFVDDIRRVLIRLSRKRKVKNPGELKAVTDTNIPRSEFIVKAGLAVAAIPLASLSWGGRLLLTFFFQYLLFAFSFCG